MKSPLRFLLCLPLFLCFFLPLSYAQFVNFEETWKEFLAEEKTSNISKITQPSKDLKEEYVKYCLMFATVNFCSDNITEAARLMREIKSVGADFYNLVPGFRERHDDLALKIEAYYETERLWQRFLQLGKVELSDLEKNEAAKRVCEKGTLAKYNYMLATIAFCEGNLDQARDYFENRVLKLAERTTLKIEDIEGLPARVKKMKTFFQQFTPLEKAWKNYLATNTSNGFEPELPVFECYPIPSIKAYVLKAAVDVCRYGAENLKAIEALQAKSQAELGGKLQEKVEWLKTEVNRYDGDMAVLNKAWQEFVVTDTLLNEPEYLSEYCEKEAQVKAYVMYGTIHACKSGQDMYEKIQSMREQYSLKLTPKIIQKIEKLDQKLEKYAVEQVILDTTWNAFIANKDTLNYKPPLVGFYCNELAMVKSYIIKGRMEVCTKGQIYLNRIDKILEGKNWTLDLELDCALKRFRAKVWDCRYWELVMQARKETHEERERFGPPSAKIMEVDLNSDKLPCPTEVRYEALGNIGIKYIISTYLCQEIDLAKMGDPEYYQKIAAWVDTEVLQKYCEESMRCKEDFFIYLEGHTDGHVFKGASYKKSLDIPEGTPFTHFTDQDTLERTTERELTNSLRSNMELGIARAWTVKHQLDFMRVPITIGAYEHPKSEKGGEFRRVEIELNITNLLLDFYEKRLAELLEASGIGERPEECSGK